MAGAGVVLAMARQQVKRAELVDADASAAVGTMAIAPADSAVFGPEVGVGGFLPGLGVAPADLAINQDLPQALDGDGRHDILSHQIVAQLGQRPDTHADQFLGRGKGHFGNLFGHIGHELSWPTPMTVVGIPRDGVDAAGVEAVNDLSYPSRGASDPLGDVPIAYSAAGEQDDSAMPAVDSVGKLSFHPTKLRTFPRPQRPCRPGADWSAIGVPPP